MLLFLKVVTRNRYHYSMERIRKGARWPRGGVGGGEPPCTRLCSDCNPFSGTEFRVILVDSSA